MTPGVGEAGVQRQGPVCASQRLVEPVEGVQGLGAVAVGHRHPGAERDGAVEPCQGFGGATQPVQRVTPVHLTHRVVGRQGQQAVEHHQGAGGIAQAHAVGGGIAQAADLVGHGQAGLKSGSTRFSSSMAAAGARTFPSWIT